MKRTIALLGLVVAMIVEMVVPAIANSIANLTNGTDILTVGTLTPMSGYFFSDMWGNNSSDMDVRSLLHGYGLVAWMPEEENLALDTTVVSAVKITDDVAGNRTYRFQLNHELMYNDGTPITARDYVFDALLRSSPVIAELGGVNRMLSHLVGFDAYQEGEPFIGVQLWDEYDFSLTISSVYLPYFYELALVDLSPVPISVIAPNFQVVDDGQGAYIQPLANGKFDAELLRKTLLDPKYGYLYMPQRTCGPYTLITYDSEKNVASFEGNDAYRGDHTGQKPEIQRIVFRLVDPESMLEQLESGELGLINKVSAADSIQAGLHMQETGSIRMTNYPRAGLNMLAFACEMGPTRSVNVRQAIALCLDKEAICNQFLQGYGLVAYGYYGLGQWMTLDQEELLELASYSYNPNAAVGLLETDGWIYNERGELFDGTKDQIRYQQSEDGSLIPLTIACALPEGAALTDDLKEQMENNLQAIGMQVTFDVLPYGTLLRQYYRQDARAYHVIQIGTNFKRVFDPFLTFHQGDEYQGLLNTTGINDSALMEAAERMRRCQPGDLEGYKTEWFAFQKCFNEVLPMVPLFSNVYFDFYREDLRSYQLKRHSSWTSAILYAYLGEERAADDAFNPESIPVEVPDI